MDGRLVGAKSITDTVEQDEVTLGGTVMNRASKLLAEEIVSGTMVGIKSMKNEITVVWPLTKDDDIRQAVEAALRSAPALHEGKLNKIAVLVDEGDVVLKGTVEKPLHSRMAQRVAEAIRWRTCWEWSGSQGPIMRSKRMQWRIFSGLSLPMWTGSSTRRRWSRDAQGVGPALGGQVRAGQRY